MADNIAFNKKTGKHSFMSVKERPWHGLGTIVQDKPTSAECIKLAGLDWDVVKVPNLADMEYDRVLSGDVKSFWDMPDDASITFGRLKERFKINPRSYNTVRTDSRIQLGSVGKDYVVIDNQRAFEFFDEIIGSKEAIYETAGALGNGECIFITAKIPTMVTLGSDNEDNLDRYIVLSNTHDGSRSLEAFITTIRVVCNNTLAAARSAAACKFRIRHTKKSEVRMEEARKILQLESNIIEAFAHGASRMINIKLPDEVALVGIASSMATGNELSTINAMFKNNDSVYLDRVFSSQKINMVNEVFHHYKRGPGSELITAKDTVWGMYNSVSSYYQNGKDYKNKTEKMNSMFYGDAYKKITNAYNVSMDMVEDLVIQ